MLEIGMSGSMSGEGKRGAAAWPKLPRLSSTLPCRGGRWVSPHFTKDTKDLQKCGGQKKICGRAFAMAALSSTPVGPADPRD